MVEPVETTLSPASKSKAPSRVRSRSASSLTQSVIPGLDPGIPSFVQSSGRLRRPSTLGAHFRKFSKLILPRLEIYLILSKTTVIKIKTINMHSVIITLLRLKLQMAMENLKIVVNINIHIIKKMVVNL